MSSDHKFLFASLSSKPPSTARKVHIRRLYDLFQICLQRNDVARATRAWSILSRCKEIPWMTMWTMSVHLLGGPQSTQQLEFLRSMMLQHREQRESIFRELILRLIQLGNHRDALNELELYLPSLPYQNNPVLHVYAGLLSLYLAQPPLKTPHAEVFNQSLMRDATAHFERAKALDPENVVALSFLNQIPVLARVLRSQGGPLESDEDDEDTSSMDVDESQQKKRLRT